MIRNVRMFLDGEDQVKAAQEYLFANGCEWNSGDKDIRQLGDQAALFVSRYGKITWGNQECFEAQSNSHLQILELTFQVNTVVVSSKIKERPKTMLFGKTYFTDELEDRLAGLEVASGRS